MQIVSLYGENFVIGETTCVEDKFLRRHITGLILKNSDMTATLEKMSAEKAVEKLKNGEITFLTANDVSKFDLSEFEFIKYNTIFLGVIVNRNCPLKTIALADLKKIFGGRESSWAFLIAGNNYSIHRFGPPENSPVYAIADRLFPAIEGGEKTLYYPIDQVEVIIESNPNAIGLVELKKNDASLRRVKLLPIIGKGADADKSQLDFYLIFPKGNLEKAKRFLIDG